MISEDLLKSLSASVERFLEEPEALKEIFDAIPLQIVVKSLREENFGHFLLWNHVTENLLGISASEALGEDDQTFFPREQAAFFDEKDREVVESGSSILIPCEYILSRKLGLRILRTIKIPILGAEGKPVALLAISEDITEWKNAEDELKKALEFLQGVNSELPGAVFQLKVDTEGRPSFPYISGGIHEITGDTPEDIVSGEVNLLARILPEDLPGFLGAVARSRRGMETCRHEFRITTLDGDIRWVMSNSSPVNYPDTSTIWHGFITDVTEQKRTLEALRRGEERLHHALDAMRAVACEFDLTTNRLYLSAEWSHIFGLPSVPAPTSLDELRRWLRPDERAIDEIFRHIGLGKWSGHVEFHHTRRDGTPAWILLSIKIVFDENGFPIRQVGTLQDISERKGMEQQLIEAKETAERANHAKGDFLAMMSHEIRTPLNAVLGFSELLHGTSLSPEQSDYLRTIQEGSSALLVVINDVLDYSKIESGMLDLSFQPVEVAQVVRSAVDIFRPQANCKGVEMISEIVGDIPRYLLCDSARFRQILFNLLSNAVKFTKRGKIVVELSPEGSTSRNICAVRLRVSDSGIGIDLQRQPLLFDPFYQADSSMSRHRGGTGLGLAIVRRLVNLLKGKIDVSSQSGQGSVFTVVLPLRIPDAVEMSLIDSEEKESQEPLRQKKRILIVEDNSTNRRLLKLLLRSLGYHADEANNGFVGVKMAEEGQYDVVFMDLEMPGMDGYDAARHILKATGENAPYIIALTAHAMPEYRERTFQAGMHAYISKPVGREELSRVLLEAIARQARTASSA